MPSEFPIDFFDQHSSRKIKREVSRCFWGKLHSIYFPSSKLRHRTSRLTCSSIHSPPNRNTPTKNVSRFFKLQNNSNPLSGSDKILLSKLLDAQDNPQRLHCTPKHPDIRERLGLVSRGSLFTRVLYIQGSKNDLY
jgi:hypothetical protein